MLAQRESGKFPGGPLEKLFVCGPLYLVEPTHIGPQTLFSSGPFSRLARLWGEDKKPCYHDSEFRKAAYKNQ